MTRDTLVRLALAVVPLLLAFGAAMVRRPSRRLIAGILLSLAWNGWALLALNLLAVHMGWWLFEANLPSFMGVAIEPWLGWTLLWGAVVPLVAFDRALGVTLVGVLWLDLIAMPLLEPVLVLRSDWLLGEAVAMLGVFLPGLLLARWTAKDTNLSARASLQVVCAGALFMWLLPAVAISRSGGSVDMSSFPLWQLSIGIQLLLVPASLGVSAVREFAQRGFGTPIPYDPPKQLVASGPYSFVRNPMQLAMFLIFFLGSILLKNVWLAGAAVVAWAYGVGLAEWHENAELSRRFEDQWTQYRKQVRSWIPRWKPHVTREATFFVAFSCATCSSVGRWFIAHKPVGLKIMPAETSNDLGLRRVTYVPATGSPSRGVAAVARALEHINLGWASVAWLLLLPGVLQLAQLIADVFGPAPHNVAGLPYDEAACHVEGA